MSLPELPAPVDATDDDRIEVHADSVIERDGEMLVLCGSDLTLLSPLASALVSTARAEALSIADVTARLCEEFGEPPGMEAGTAVRQVIAALAQRGIIEVHSASAMRAQPAV